MIARNFDLLAPHYRWMEFVLAGGKLHGCRTRFLDEFARAKNVLLLGEGNGRFLAELLRRDSTRNVTCLDASAAMQRATRHRLARLGLDAKLVRFVHADVLACGFDSGAFDAIAANFFLDCFPPAQLERVAQRIGQWAAPGARLIVSDFRCPERGVKRWRAETILGVMYLFFRIATRLPARKLTAPQNFLERSGFQLIEQNEREWGLLYSELWRKRNH